MDDFKKLEEQIERFSEDRWFSDADFVFDLLVEMAKREKREVLSRLVVLIGHILKCEAFPRSKTSSWESTIINQQNELSYIFESSKTLELYAESVIDKAYADAVKQFSKEARADLSYLDVKPLSYYLNYNSQE